MKRLLTCLALLGFGTFATAAEPVYATDIRPILADNCYECHGPDKAKGGLRLDSPDGIRAGSKQRAVIIPGNPGKSPLYTVTMLPPNDDDFMPAKGEPLKAVQQDLLKAWIAAGAKFGDGAPASTTTPIAAAESPTIERSAAAPARDPRQTPALAKLLATGMAVEADGDGWLVNAAHLPKGVNEEHLRLFSPAGPDIVNLGLAGSGITDRQVKLLAPLTGLLCLDLSRNPDLGDIGLGELARLPAANTLESLNLYATGITDRGVDSLGKFTALDRIYLWQTKLTPTGIERLHKVLLDCHIVLGPTDLPSQPLVKGAGKRKKK